MTAARLATLVLLADACVPAADADVSRSAEVVQPVRAAPAPTPTPTPTPTPSPTPTRAAVFTFDGELEQGGWIRGTVPG
ncbi:MAG: M23 family peptidase, partial [Pseudomonadota bacterium]|nr:M23 family peptidase [Pseudomonadota bacterium]